MWGEADYRARTLAFSAANSSSVSSPASFSAPSSLILAILSSVLGAGGGAAAC